MLTRNLSLLAVLGSLAACGGAADPEPATQSPSAAAIPPAAATPAASGAAQSSAPAGVQNANAGHHHLLIDTALPPLDAPIPADATHVHFGKGQTEADIELAPGRHELRLLVGDHAHVPHDPPIVSAPITITVQ